MADQYSTQTAVADARPSYYTTMTPDQLVTQALELAGEIAEKDDRKLSLLYAIRDRVELAFQEADSANAHAALNLTEILAEMMGDAEESLMLRDMLKNLSEKVAA